MEDLPYFVESILYDDEEDIEEERKWFLTLNRTLDGEWSCGYITWDDEGREMAIPQLVTNHSTSLDEVGIRMKAKLNNWRKLHG